MTFTLTDKELEQIIRKATETAAKNAAAMAVEEVLKRQAAATGSEHTHTEPANKKISISRATAEEAEMTMEAMAANLGNQNKPKVGIFWYQIQGERLFGVVAVNKDSFARPNVGGGLISCTELHKDVWKKKFKEQKYKLNGQGPYVGDYKDHARGRIFYNPKTDTYQIMVGSWIKGNEKAINMIVDEFNLTDVHYEVKISYHWEIGVGWENQ